MLIAKLRLRRWQKVEVCRILNFTTLLLCYCFERLPIGQYLNAGANLGLVSLPDAAADLLKGFPCRR